jgi:hypothetical protein
MGKGRPRKNLTGKTFARLTALKCVGVNQRGKALWICKCSCGETSTVLGYRLTNGSIRSCGCLLTEALTKHGGSGWPEFRVWGTMLSRCRNRKSKSFPRYGGRGITVCKRWERSFKAFIEDMGRRPTTASTIERLNNDKGYCPSNCVWASRRQQGRNKSNNVVLSHAGTSMTLCEWAEKLCVSPRLLRVRLWRGWSTGRTLTTPVLRRNPCQR